MRIVYLALGWTMGIVLAATLGPVATPFLSLPVLWLIAFAISITMVGLVWSSRWRWLFITLVAVCAGGYRYQFVPQTSAVAWFNEGVGLTIEGVIVSDPDVRDDRTQIRVSVERVLAGLYGYPVEGLVLVNAPRLTDVQYGQRVQATGRLTTPAEFDTFSYRDYLARQGVFSVMSNAVITPLPDSTVATVPLTGFWQALYTLRSTAQIAIARALPEPQAGLLTGILLGNERGIAPELSDDFSLVGATHIIAISGFNMVIVSSVVTRTLRLLMSERRAVLVGVVFIALYTLFVGANAAVVRAAIMSVLLVVAPLVNRRTYVPASLAFVVLLMSVLNPTVLWDVSFQLSFFAVLGLALFATPLKHGFSRLAAQFMPQNNALRLTSLLNEPLLVTLAALSTTLPLTFVYFQQWSPYVLLVNMLIVPAQTYLLIIGGLATITALMGLWPLAQVLYWLDMLLLSWSIGVVRTFASLPGAGAAITVDPRWIALYFAVLMIGAMMYAERPRWLQALAAFIVRRPVLNATLFAGGGIAILLFALFVSRPDGRLHVWFLDIGHHHGVFVQTPNGAHILIDGGRFPSRLLTALGDRMPFHDRTIELLIITHPDEYDIAALIAVLARYDVGAVITNGQPNLSATYTQLQAALTAHDVVVAHAGYTVEIDDGVLLEVLHPSTTPELGDPMGDGALVLRLTYGDVSFLITGDLTTEGQEALLANDQWPVASVLQLPQHGTARSLDAAFLDAVQPQIVVLQSDPTNRRGDPDDRVLALVQDIHLFRTDEAGGHLHLWTDGGDVWVMP